MKIFNSAFFDISDKLGRQRKEGKNMDLRNVERIVRHAGHLMSESLWDYWPTAGDNDIPERNISLYLALAFYEKGFKCFTEGNWKDSTDKRIDFIAVHPDAGIAVCGEFKKLFSSEKCLNMLEDFKRVQSFEPLEHCGKYKTKFGVLAATTFKTEIAEWWSTKDGKNPFDNESWELLFEHMKDAYWGSVPLNSYDEEIKLKNTEKHYFLYAIFEINQI
jgi:hypothetical protein